MFYLRKETSIMTTSLKDKFLYRLLEDLKVFRTCASSNLDDLDTRWLITNSESESLDVIIKVIETCCND